MANIIRKVVTSPQLPKPLAPYSPAVLVDNTLYLSGQVGLDAKTMKLVDGGIQAQTHKALENMGHLLKAAETTYNNVIKTTVLLADIKDFSTVNDIYKEYFKDVLPARTAYQAGALPLGALVEIEAVAVVGEVTTIQA